MQFTGRISFNWRKLNWCFCNNEKFSSNQLLLIYLQIASNKQHHWKAKFNKCWSYFEVFLGILLQAHMLVVVSKCVWEKMIRSSGCKVIAILLVSALLCTDLSHCEAHVEYSVLRKWIMLSELSCLVQQTSEFGVSQEATNISLLICWLCLNAKLVLSILIFETPNTNLM